MTSVNVTENKYSVSVTEGATTVVTVKAPGPQGVQGATGATGAGISAGDKGALTVAANLTDWTLNDSVVTNAKVSASAGILGTKISPDFGSQNITTTGNAVFGGNLTVSGTTTTIDSTTLRVEDKNIELGKVGSPTDITADGGGITLLGDTNHTFNWLNATDSWTSSEHIALPDNKKLKLGADNDIEIYSNGSHGFIQGKNTQNGQLHLNANNILIKNAINSKSYIRAYNNGSVELYFDNVKKAETSADGFDLPDNSKLQLGDSQDIQVYWDGSAGFVTNQGGGNLHFNSDTVLIKNAANTKSYIRAYNNSSVELYHNNVKQCETSSVGLDFAVDKKIRMNTNLTIYRDNNHGYIDHAVGALKIRSDTLRINDLTNDHSMIHADADGAVELYHDNVKKAETTSTGLDVDGNVIANNLIVAGGVLHEDYTNTGMAFDGTSIKFISNGVQRLRIGQFAAFVTTGYKLAFTAASGENPSIRSGGTNNGDLLIESGTASMAQFKRNGAVELYHNGTKKAETSSTGLDVTGAVKASTGILFGSDTADANTLDDYEQGTFTPTLEGSSSNPTVNYSTQLGYYTKIGNVVHIQLYLQTSSYTGGGGEWQCGGLPFTASSTATASFHFNWNQNSNIDWHTNTLSLGIYVAGGTSRVRARKFGSFRNLPLNLSNFGSSNTTVFGIHGSYIAA
jgi:hypothetical protein